MPRYLQDAVSTEIGYAHPLTGEQLTAQKGLSDPVDYYSPNNRNAPFLDPEAPVDGLLMFQKTSATGLTARFVFQTARADVESISWDFGHGSPVVGGKKITHTFPTDNTAYDVEATVTFEDTSTDTYTVEISFGTVPAAPTNTVLPSITGTAQVDQTLTAVDGTWTGSPTFGYLWLANGTLIPEADDPTYLVKSGDLGKTISVRVTGTNGGGSASADSAPTSVVIAA